MVSLPVFDKSGAEVGKYEIDPTELAPHINKQLLHDVVVMYQANQRQGTFRTKNRSEVAGSTQKMYRQKGTGHARAGSRRAVQRRGGSHAFAKRPRDFSYRLPRKAVKLATRMAIASKIRDSQIVVIDDLKFEAPKTKDMVAVIDKLKLAGNTLLVTTDGYDVNVFKSARNIAGVTVSPAHELNALAVLAPRRMLVTRSALDSIRAKAAGGESKDKE